MKCKVCGEMLPGGEPVVTLDDIWPSETCAQRHAEHDGQPFAEWHRRILRGDHGPQEEPA